MRVHPPLGYALGKADGAGRAHQLAQVAADTLASHDTRLVVIAEGNGLVPTVTA